MREQTYWLFADGEHRGLVASSSAMSFVTGSYDGEESRIKTGVLGMDPSAASAVSSHRETERTQQVS
jgi:hypothetical protein